MTASEAYLVVSATGKRIPADEPMFMLRAKDPIAADNIMDYQERAILRKCEHSHLDALTERARAFYKFKQAYPARMAALPNTQAQ